MAVSVKIGKKAPNKWTVTLNSDQKWSDGSIVTAQDFVTGWTTRKPVADKLGLGQVTSIEGVGANVLQVNFKSGTTGAEEQAVLSSIWLSPLKTNEKTTEWKAEIELAEPCNGAFLVGVQSATSATLTRFKTNVEAPGGDKMAAASEKKTGLEGEAMHPVPLDNIQVTGSEGPSYKTVADLMAAFTSKKIFYAPPMPFSPQERSDFISYFRTTIGGPAYYFWINPQGSIQGKSLKFIHQSINRGELVVFDNEGNVLRTMNRLIPLSIVSENTYQPLLEGLTNLNFESVQDASATLNIPVGKPPANKKPLTIHLQIPEGKFFGDIAQRYTGRLRANYGVEVVTKTVSKPIKTRLPNSVDMALIEVDGGVNVRQWAGLLAAQLRTQVQSSAIENASLNGLDALANLDATASDGQILTLLNDVDKAMLGAGHLLPLGQIGKEFLIDPSMHNIKVYGDVEMDPDLSRAEVISILQ